MKYWKLPDEIEAVQLRWSRWGDICELIAKHGGGGWPSAREITWPEVSDDCGEIGGVYIALDVITAHGDPATVRHGDWLVPDVEPGTYYPIKPDVFAATYVAAFDTGTPTQDGPKEGTSGLGEVGGHSATNEANDGDDSHDVVPGALEGPSEPKKGLVGEPSAHQALTFERLSAVNRKRCGRWHHQDTEPWTAADWSNAMCGEAGEAANVVKKLRRIELGTTGALDTLTVDELREKLADEIADVVLYADLLAAHFGLSLVDCVVPKFNRVSIAQGFPERLAAFEPRPVARACFKCEDAIVYVPGNGWGKTGEWRHLAPPRAGVTPHDPSPKVFIT